LLFSFGGEGVAHPKPLKNQRDSYRNRDESECGRKGRIGILRLSSTYKGYIGMIHQERIEGQEAALREKHRPLTKERSPP